MSATELKKAGGRMAAMTPKHCADAGLALVFVFLLVALLGGQSWAVWAAAGATLALMTAPVLFKPFAVAWFGLSHVMGAVMSRLILSLVFFLVVTPVAVLRRALGKDPMRLRQWKAGQDSVFTVRDATVSAQDLERPF
ncbi:MAG: SxtJ family membrane protein [Thermodesulfobacteriota bacterium]